MLTSQKVRPAVQLVGVASWESTPLDVFALFGQVALAVVVVGGCGGGLAGGNGGVGSDSLIILVGSHC